MAEPTTYPDLFDEITGPVPKPACPNCGSDSIAETGNVVRCVSCLQLLVRVRGGFALRFDWMRAGKPGKRRGRGGIHPSGN